MAVLLSLLFLVNLLSSFYHSNCYTCPVEFFLVVLLLIEALCFISYFLWKQRIDLNIYSPNASSTSMVVPCNSTACVARTGCAVSRNACAYQISYLSNGTSSTGILVEDVLHLATDDSQQKAIEAPITLGLVLLHSAFVYVIITIAYMKSWYVLLSRPPVFLYVL